MIQARETILSRIAKALGASTPDAGHIRDEALALVVDPDLFRPTFLHQTSIERFIEKAKSERVTATVTRIPSILGVPDELALYIREKHIESPIAVQPRSDLTDLDWKDIEIHFDPSPNESLAVSIADLAIAETGSVVFLSGRDAPTLLNFLPLHHVVVVKASQIRPYLEDVSTFVGEGYEKQPRNINIVTGTSGTADIEAKNIRGAHGPRYMHILLIDDV